MIKVGAASEVEMKEKKHRIEDAVAATKAAIEEGIVAGGGVALIRAQAVLDGIDANADEKIGLGILRRAIESPLRQIAENAGHEGGVIIARVKSMTGNNGWDAALDKDVDMVVEGIIDPAKVTRSALQNAASVAVMILTTEAAITDIPKVKEDSGAGAGGGMGDMY